MTRKSEKKGEGGKSEGKDYMKLKSIIEEFIERGCCDYVEDLDTVLIDIAKTGVVRLPWRLLKPLLTYKLDKCLNETFESTKSSDNDMEKQLTELMDKFEGPPFTIQRLCELLLDPCKHYRRKDRYMRALERNLLVVSTQEPDLVWMKVPTLSQLLEVKQKQEDTITPSPEVILEKEPVMRDHALRDTPISPPVRKLPSPHSLSPRALTPPPSLTPPTDLLTGRWDGFMEARLTRESFFPRKRSSSFRSNEEVELQEADSTVSDNPESGKKGFHDDSDETNLLSALLGGFKKEDDSETTPTSKEDKANLSHDDHMTATPTELMSSPSQQSSNNESVNNKVSPPPPPSSPHLEEMEVN